jgi:two-component system response regulator (stage 0 sporulation protein F)
VDDEADVREFASSFFRKRKIEVITASSGEEALSVLETQKPDLILLDIKMTGIDGIETLRRIKKRDKNSRVIMVSGTKSEDNDSLQKCQQYGALDFIHKPLELDELESIVLKTLSEK